MARQKNHILTALLLFILALIIRVGIIAHYQFDGLYGQDAYAYYDFGGDLLYFLRTFNPPPPFFWSIGYPSLLATGFLIAGTSEWVALSISLLMGALLAPLVYGLGLQFKLRPAYAFVAGLLMAISGQAWQSSLVIMSDIPTLFWAVLSAFALWRYIHTNKRRWLLLCALTISFSVLTRWIYLILPPIYLVTLYMLFKRRIRWFDLSLALIIALIPAIPQVIYNQINSSPTLDHAWVQGWSPVNMLAKDFVNIDGTFHYETINALFYAYPVYDARYVSPLISLFLILGVSGLIRRKQPAQTCFILLWLILPYLFLAGIPYQNIRFSLIVMPIVTLCIAFGLEAVATWIKLREKKLRFVSTGLIGILCLAGLLHTAITGYDYANAFIEKQSGDKAIVTWLEERIPEDATLYTFDITLTLKHYSSANIIELFYESPSSLNQRWFKGRDDYLLINVWQIENQWDGMIPQDNYHWFRDERGLQELGRFHNFTLFKVNE